MLKLSLKQKRVICGIALALLVFFAANYYLELRVFGDYDKEVLFSYVMILLLSFKSIVSTIDEMRVFRDEKRMKKNDPGKK